MVGRGYLKAIYPTGKYMLEKLAAYGYRLYIAHYKSEPYTEKEIKSFGIFDLVTFIGGNNKEDSFSNKKDIINYVFSENNIYN